MLQTAWKYYLQTFSNSPGQILDPLSSRTTSEGQSYSLLRSVWLNDQQGFDQVWGWTQEHMELENTHLFAWLYGTNEENGQEAILDEGTATDADQDIALALVYAYKKWEKVEYLNQAKKIINDIWRYETVEIRGKRYVVAGNWASAKDNNVFTLNPSYLTPYAYRIFAEIDTTHNWAALVDTSYDILEKCTESSFSFGGSANIPPDWCVLDRNEKVVVANDMGHKSTNYSYDALRTLWRIALDYRWYQEPRALRYLQKMDIWTKEWNENKQIASGYSHDGLISEKSESLAHYGTQVAFFTVINSKISDQIFKQKILSQWNEEGYWGDKSNYYDQNWAWFGTAFYTDKLPNLWVSDITTN